MQAVPFDGKHTASAWIARGAVFGLVAGVVFAMFEMVAAALMGDGFWMPLRMIGAIVLGAEALEASYSLAGAATVGAVVHMMLSALYGATFGAIATLLRSRASIVAGATVFGLALWLINFYAIAPVAFEWFQDANARVQFVAHTFAFGALLGLLLAALPPIRGRTAEPDGRAAEALFAAGRPADTEKRRAGVPERV